MKVLALSDLHAEQRVLDGLASLVAKRRYDAVFLVGDVSDYGNVKYVDSLFDILEGNSVYAIPGNMDELNVRDKIKEYSHYIDLKISLLGRKYHVFGIGGGMRGPFSTPYEYDDDKLWDKISGIALEPPSIVLSHSPPYGYFDDVGMDVHIGSRSVLRFMQANKPFLLFCGHVHEHKGHIEIDGTHIVKLKPASSGHAAEVHFLHNEKHKNEIAIQWIKMF